MVRNDAGISQAFQYCSHGLSNIVVNNPFAEKIFENMDFYEEEWREYMEYYLKCIISGLERGVSEVGKGRVVGEGG